MNWSDGGFSQSGIIDRNNCTVVALANATGWSYQLCDRIAIEAGRNRGRPFRTQVLLDRTGIAGPVTEWEYPISLYELLLKLDRNGTYIVSTGSHAFVIKRGQVLDYKLGFQRQIRRMWKIQM